MGILLAFLGGIFVGSIVGIVVMALFAASKDIDMPQYYERNEETNR